MDGRGREQLWAWAGLVALGGAAIALRALGLAPALPDHDAVNFALGLEHFDLAAHRPHFPGYPVFLALAWPLRALGLGPATALALPAMLLSAATTVAVGAALLRFGRSAALLGAALMATLPGLAIADATPLSDGLGAQLVAMGAAALLTSTRPPRSAGAPPSAMWGRLAVVAFALLPGVRASSVVVAAVGLLVALVTADRRERLVRLGLGVAVVAVWLVPLVALAGGPGALLDVGQRFTRGHFETWGGTAMSANAPGAVERLGLLGRNLLLVALGPAAAVALAIALAASRPGRRWWSVLLALGLPYAVWVVFAQNPDKPRHLLPLLPLIVLAAAPAAARVTERLRPALTLVPLAVLAVTAPRLVEAARPSPAAQAATWLARSTAPEQLQVYAGEETAVLRTYAPTHRTVMVHDAADVLRDRRERGNSPRTMLVTSTVPAVGTLPGRLVERARFDRSPLVDPHAPSLVVWEWIPPGTLRQKAASVTHAPQLATTAIPKETLP